MELDALITGAAIEPGDAIVGLPSSGVHSNGFTLARRALHDLNETPPVLGGATVGETLLEPTVIYVRAVRELLESDADVRGLAHITGEGFLNLLRLDAPVGYRIDAPLPVPPIFDLIAERGAVAPAELYEVFNMGCGFCCVVPWDDADAGGRAARPRATGRRGDRPRHATRRAWWSCRASGLESARKAEGFRPSEPRPRSHSSPVEHPLRLDLPLRRQPPQLRAARVGRAGRRPPPPPRSPCARSARSAAGTSGAAVAGGLGARGHAAARQLLVVRGRTTRDPASSSTDAAAEGRRAGPGRRGRTRPRPTLEVGPEGLHDRVRAEVDAEARHVEPGPARLLDERLGGVELAPEAEDPLAQRAQVARLRLRPLLGRGLHRHARRVARLQRRLAPQARVERHARARPRRPANP